MVPYRKSRVPPPPPDCPLLECVRFISGTWTPGVIWYLRGGPRRFTELKVDLYGISAKVLAARLRHLCRGGIVCRREMPTSPPTVEYALTALGEQLVPAFEVLMDVGKELKKKIAPPAEGRVAEPAPAGGFAAEQLTPAPLR